MERNIKETEKTDNMPSPSIQDFLDLYKKHEPGDCIIPSQFLWHYTSADGLMGIIRDEPSEHKKLHFWFTRSDCLNDPSEGKHILLLFRQICSELLEKNAISQSFFDIIKDAEIPNTRHIVIPLPSQEKHTHEHKIESVPCHSYICSFSLKEDSLDMWRYYSKGNGGYGLKCWSILFEKIKENQYSDNDKNATFCLIKSYRVIYDPEEKKRILETIITDAFSAFKNTNQPEDYKRKAVIAFIQYELKTFQFQFKHECYESEQEYRFVVDVPYSKPQSLKNELPRVKFRKQNGTPIPYIDLALDDGVAYLYEVMISPLVESENVLTTTSDYLSQCGFDCKVRVSQLPVRK